MFDHQNICNYCKTIRNLKNLNLIWVAHTSILWGRSHSSHTGELPPSRNKVQELTSKTFPSQEWLAWGSSVSNRMNQWGIAATVYCQSFRKIHHDYPAVCQLNPFRFPCSKKGWALFEVKTQKNRNQSLKSKTVFWRAISRGSMQQ